MTRRLARYHWGAWVGLGLTVVCLAGALKADIPHQINFQGILKDGSGNPVSDGPWSVVFTLWDSNTLGTALWAETTSVTTTGGLFNRTLGLIHPIPDLVLNDSSRWLGVKVAGDPEMSPRQKLASVAYSYRVGTVDGATGGSIDGSLSFGNGATPMAYIYESGGPNPSRPVLSHSPAFPNYGLSYDDFLERMDFKGLGGSSVLSIGLDSRFVSVNRTTQITSAEYFGVHAPVGAGNFGGMYISTLTGGLPFYGYYNGSYLSYHYVDTSGNFLFNHGGATRLFMTQAGNLGMGTVSPAGVLHTASGGGQAVLSPAGAAALFAGNVAITGDLQVIGTVSKGGGAFKIDHPTDPEHKYLYHSFVESPDMKTVYDGVVVTDASGHAQVELPEWFEAVNRDFRYQLTVIGDFAQAVVSSEIADHHFGIRTDRGGVKVSWQVTGIRHDAWANAHRIPLEEPKSTEDIGRYLHPELYGKGAEAGIAQRSLENASIAAPTGGAPPER